MASRTHFSQLATYVAALLLAIRCASPVNAQPVFNSMTPYGFQRGTSTPITLNGNRLSDPSIHLLSYTEGISISDLKSDKPVAATAVLVVEENVPIGLHAVRLVSDRGISALRTVYVGALPTVDEVEPNNSAEEAQVLTDDCMVAGTSLVRGEDWYQIDVPEGWPRLSVEVHGTRLGNQFYDPLIEVYGPDGAMIEKCDDTPLCRQDPFIVVPSPAVGTYRIMIRDVMYRGSDRYKYLLHVGKFPRPSLSQPTGAPAGTDVELAWFDAGRKAFQQKVTVAVDAKGTVPLTPQDDFGLAPSPVPFSVDSEVVHESEPNNKHSEANEIQWPVVIDAELAAEGDTDYFKLSATKGETIRFLVRSRVEIRSPVDAVVTVFNSQGGYLASNDDSGGPDSVLDYVIPEDGDYFVSARDFLRRGAPGHRYRLHVTRPPRRLDLSLPERRRNESVTLAVPQNNRMAVLVQANRVGQGGEVSLRVEDLPEGTSFQSPALPGDRVKIPLLVSATAEASPAAALCPLSGTCKEGERSVIGRLSQRQLLVAGENNRDMWGFDADRIAVAVTKAAPFQIDLVSPKVPIVQRGVMQLTIQATRDPGFDAPITIQSLYMPPGLSGKGRVTIPEKETTIKYALNANDKARLGTPSLVVLARAPHEGTEVEVASALVPISIATPLVSLKSPNVSLTQGGGCEMKLGITVNTAFAGRATAELLNLPSGVTAETIDFDADQQELVFQVAAANDARIGRKGGLICRVVITQQEEPITHMIPVGQLRVDPPATAVAGGGR